MSLIRNFYFEVLFRTNLQSRMIVRGNFECLLKVPLSHGDPIVERKQLCDDPVPVASICIFQLKGTPAPSETCNNPAQKSVLHRSVICLGQSLCAVTVCQLSEGWSEGTWFWQVD